MTLWVLARKQKCTANIFSLSYLLAQKIIVILGGDWADAMHDQSDVLFNSGPIYRAYPRRAKVGDADCYPLLKALFKTPDAMFLSAANGN